jgi:outer membrane receptor protein involved in Fe transport
LRDYQCRNGILDINSATCQNALSSIVRAAPTDADHLGVIDFIDTPKVNVAKEQLNAVLVNANYLQNIGSFGKLLFNASYSNVLKHDLQQFPTDPVIDELRDPTFSTDFKTKANASITWTLDRWSATVYGNRYGQSPNYAATLNGYAAPHAGKLPAWYVYNASVSYNPLDNLTLSFLVNNVFNKMPPIDHSMPGTVGQAYNEFNYNVNGRGMYLEATYKFGSTK